MTFSFFSIKNFFKKWCCETKKETVSASVSLASQFLAFPISDLMVPRSDILAVDIQTPFQDLVKIFLRSNFQALPVYRDTLDHMAGVINVRCLLSLLEAENEDKWNRYLSPVTLVPSAITVKEAFQKIGQGHKDSLLFIVDEHGGVEGMVTKNHLLKEFSLHCLEEEQEDPQDSFALAVGTVAPVISGRMDLEAFEEEFDAKNLFTSDDENKVNTIGGWLCAFLGRMPTKGEIIRHPSGFVFEITKTDPRKIHEITILKTPDAHAG